ncbi:MAG TPA: LD-carboxypeptidase [Thermoanaerobaculia bacterium]|nr:LD-carboxypeptidase [Thermoanaerobaculia bacterium]
MKTRREVLRLAGAAAAGAVSAAAAPKRTPAPAPSAAASRPMVKPKTLKQGDTIGLITPSSYVFDTWRVDLAAARMEAVLGVKCRLGRYVKARHGYMAGTEKERLEDLHSMFADPSVSGVFCLEGGYGTERLLPGIDYELLRKNPKVLLGYSDITGLHLAITKKAGLVTFHGPVAMGSMPSWSLAALKKAIFSAEPIGELANPPEDDPNWPVFPLHAVSSGKARGAIAGGNLTLVSTTMGTPWEIDAKGKILFLEDTGEAPYRVDRMLTQMKLAGKFDECAGIVWGTCTECTAAKSSYEVNLSISDILDEILGPLGKPVLAGLVFGHTKEKATIPMGVEAELDAGSRKVAIVEGATLSS